MLLPGGRQLDAPHPGADQAGEDLGQEEKDSGVQESPAGYQTGRKTTHTRHRPQLVPEQEVDRGRQLEKGER